MPAALVRPRRSPLASVHCKWVLISTLPVTWRACLVGCLALPHWQPGSGRSRATRAPRPRKPGCPLPGPLAPGSSPELAESGSRRRRRAVPCDHASPARAAWAAFPSVRVWPSMAPQTMLQPTVPGSPTEPQSSGAGSHGGGPWIGKAGRMSSDEGRPWNTPAEERALGTPNSN